MHNKHESQVRLPMQWAGRSGSSCEIPRRTTRSAIFSTSDRVSPNTSADGHRKASSLCRVAHGTQQEVFQVGTARQCSLFRQEEVVTEVDDQPPQAVLQHIHAKKGLTKFERRMAVSPSSGGRACQDASDKYYHESCVYPPWPLTMLLCSFCLL
jgi:hypothetical protein